MNAIASLILAEQHLLDLRREADAARLVAEAVGADAPAGPGPVKRLVGRSARSLSRGFAAIAARVDPVEAGRPSSDRTARPVAA
jgi:hypothetical protein